MPCCRLWIMGFPGRCRAFLSRRGDWQSAVRRAEWTREGATMACSGQEKQPGQSEDDDDHCHQPDPTHPLLGRKVVDGSQPAATFRALVGMRRWLGTAPGTIVRRHLLFVTPFPGLAVSRRLGTRMPTNDNGSLPLQPIRVIRQPRRSRRFNGHSACTSQRVRGTTTPSVPPAPLDPPTRHPCRHYRSVTRPSSP